MSLFNQRAFQRLAKAFTLIELLVVIAIIALLAAILFPVFGRARENARRSSCQSNLKQIALGVTQYSQDYDEFFPRIVVAAGTGSPFGWGRNIQPYLKSNQVLGCPSEKDNVSTVSDNPNYTHYSLNTRLNILSPTVSQSRNLSQVTYASQTVMLTETPGGTARNNLTGCLRGWDKDAMAATDESDYGCDSVQQRALPAWLPLTTLSPPSNEATRHLGGVNFAFVDGHVKWFKASNFVASSDPYRRMESGTVYNGFLPIGSGPTTTPSTSDGKTVVFGFGL